MQPLVTHIVPRVVRSRTSPDVGPCGDAGSYRMWNMYPYSIFRSNDLAGRELLKRCKDVFTRNGSSPGQNLALTGPFVASSLDSGRSCLSACEWRVINKRSFMLFDLKARIKLWSILSCVPFV